MDRLSLLLSKGLVIYTHEPEEYCYLGWPGENDGCLSYQVSREYVEEQNIPIMNLNHLWFELPNGEKYPLGL